MGVGEGRSLSSSSSSSRIDAFGISIDLRGKDFHTFGDEGSDNRGKQCRSPIPGQLDSVPQKAAQLFPCSLASQELKLLCRTAEFDQARTAPVSAPTGVFSTFDLNTAHFPVPKALILRPSSRLAGVAKTGRRVHSRILSH